MHLCDIPSIKVLVFKLDVAMESGISRHENHGLILAKHGWKAHYPIIHALVEGLVLEGVN